MTIDYIPPEHPGGIGKFVPGVSNAKPGWRCPVCNIGVAPWCPSCPACSRVAAKGPPAVSNHTIECPDCGKVFAVDGKDERKVKR